MAVGEHQKKKKKHEVESGGTKKGPWPLDGIKPGTKGDWEGPHQTIGSHLKRTNSRLEPEKAADLEGEPGVGTTGVSGCSSTIRLDRGNRGTKERE